MTITPLPRRTVRVERVMGTVVSFDLREGGAHTAALDAAVARLHGIDARFSTYRPDSEVSRYGRGELRAEDLSADLRHVVDACRRFEERSGGAFGTVLPGGWDPSAYVKGWAVDQAAAILDEHGCTDWSINAGGDVRTRRSRSRPPWRIGIRHPDDPGAVAAIVPAWDLAVATSGRYERGDHLIDPRTGDPARGARSTTVTGPDLASADASATAAFVLGAGGPAWVARQPGHECWTVLPERSVSATSGFPRFIGDVPFSASRPSSFVEETA